MLKFNRLLSVALTAVAASVAVEAATLKGTVTDSDGRAIHGAMVRLKDAEKNLAETVYSDSEGNFVLNTELHSDNLELRVRAPYYRDQKGLVSLQDETVLVQDVLMERMTGAQEISDSLPAIFHFSKLPFDKEEGEFNRADFQRDCAGCHQFGNAFTRWPRTAEQWIPTVARMHSYMGNKDEAMIQRRAELLAKGYDGKPVTLRPEFPMAPELQTAKIYEYALPGIIFPHDAEVSREDGLVYTVDRHGYKMIVSDLESGLSTYIDQPYSKAKLANAGNGYTGRTNKPGPHSLSLGENGLWYITNATSGSIGVFDANKAEWVNEYELPLPAHYPHTIRVDKENVVWFTLAGSQQIGRIDPATDKVDLINLPRQKPLGIALSTTPYGIDINPINGRVWYARLYGDRIGYIDPETLEAHEFDSPVKAPRRLRFDKKGQMWLTGYSEGMIARINTDTMENRIYPIPEFEEGYRPAPYALGVHPQTQEIWINEVMTDHVYRLQPDTGKFIAYPLPLRGTYTRDFSFTNEGWACTANSPIPNAALEDFTAGLFCIDPNLAEQ
ncbi:carboxypeptidase regulatory-like domain-containing protein [Maricurvus nonylphenolicus]|uniref:carboxypeptidase regulatory-like domain-containing protein n=1 Tax=Maricurvus nonylphenolicus TaxID=1008307 RepID=UPI0036F20BDC